MVVVAGASGKTGSRIATTLLRKREKVRAVARSAEKLLPLQDQGAEIWAGDLMDVEFLSYAFKGADAAYLMVPPNLNTSDIRQYYRDMGQSMFDAILQSGLKKIVFLSSLGAERISDTGIVLGLHDVEVIFQRLTHVDIVFLRSAPFMQNNLSSISLIKQQHYNSGFIESNIPVYMCDTRDIGDKAAELLAQRAFPGHSVQDLFGDRLSYREVSREIGAQIGIPDLPYVRINETDAYSEYIDMGFSRNVAQLYIELERGISEGKIHPTVTNPSEPTVPTTFAKFVKDIFVPAYKN